MRIRPIRLLLVSALLPGAFSAQPAPAVAPSVAPEKAALIREYLDLLGVTQMSRQVIASLSESVRRSNPKLDAGVWERLVRKLDPNDLTPQIVAVYDRHLSLEDLQGLVAFYRSPVGQRVIAATPQLLQETIAIGQEWGRRKAAELQQELEAEEQENRKAAEGAAPAGA